MNKYGRVTIGLLWMVGSIPMMANTIWTDGTLGTAGPLQATAQTIWGDNQSLDAILGNLPDANSAAMFQILITDPANFTADVIPSPLDPTSQVIPQIFLFDSGGAAISGGIGAFVGNASIPFGPNVPGYYYLLVNSVGLDPIYTVTAPDGTQSQQPLFCQGLSYDSSALLPCAGVGTQPIAGYQGQGVYNAGITGNDPYVSGAYAVLLTGVTAPAPAPEPGTVFLLLSGAILVLAGKKRPSVAGSVIRVISRLRASCV
jgi:hypothetical protein